MKLEWLQNGAMGIVRVHFLGCNHMVSGVDLQDPGERPLRPVGDAEAAACIATRAFLEIRYLASSARADSGLLREEDRKRIRLIADIAHLTPGVALSAARRWRRRPRPMSWVWSTTDPEGQALMLEWIKDAGLDWSPPKLPRP
jgi:hypothetical protein